MPARPPWSLLLPQRRAHCAEPRAPASLLARRLGAPPVRFSSHGIGPGGRPSASEPWSAEAGPRVHSRRPASPTRRSVRSAPFGRRCHPSGRVPPSRSLTALTACSARGLRACCIPQPAMGFAAFGAIRMVLSRSSGPPGSPSPRRVHPSKRFPRQQPYRVTTPSRVATTGRVTAAVALLSLPLASRELPGTSPAQPEALAFPEGFAAPGALSPEGVFAPAGHQAPHRSGRLLCRSAGAVP